MQRIRNVTEYFLYDTKKTDLKFFASGSEEATLCEFDITPLGPVAVRVQAPDEKKGEPGQSWLVGVYESAETLRFAVPFKAAKVVLEPSGEVWVRRPHVAAASENPNPDETFTRMEKQGIDMDPMSIALHRQAVMNRIATGRDNAERDSYTASLERKLAEISQTVDQLKAARAAEEASTTEE